MGPVKTGEVRNHLSIMSRARNSTMAFHYLQGKRSHHYFNTSLLSNRITCHCVLGCGNITLTPPYYQTELHVTMYLGVVILDLYWWVPNLCKSKFQHPVHCALTLVEKTGTTPYIWLLIWFNLGFSPCVLSLQLFYS